LLIHSSVHQKIINILMYVEPRQGQAQGERYLEPTHLNPVREFGVSANPESLGSESVGSPENDFLNQQISVGEHAWRQAI
jgi:hypothetical protein